MTKVIDNYQYDESDIFETSSDISNTGNFGYVFRGTNVLNNNEKIAVRVIDKKYADESEINKWKSLNCINIVKLFHSKTIGNEAFLIMELCDLNMHEYIANFNYYFIEGDVTDVILQIAKGLKYIHERGIVHGDVRPVNVYKKGALYKLTNFPLTARKAGSLSSLNTGSSNYKAPELINGIENKINAKVDIYSLGKIACFMFTQNENDLRYDKASDDLKTLISKMVEIDPKVRIEVGAVVDHLVEATPINIHVRYGEITYVWTLSSKSRVADLKTELSIYYRNQPSRLSLQYGSVVAQDDSLLTSYDHMQDFTLTMQLTVSIKDGNENYQYQTTSNETIKQLQQQFVTERNKNEKDGFLEFNGEILDCNNQLHKYDIHNNEMLKYTQKNDILNVFIIYRDQSYTFPITPNTTVLQLKKAFSKKIGSQPRYIALTFNGESLEDNCLLASYKIYNNATIMWMTLLLAGSTD